MPQQPLITGLRAAHNSRTRLAPHDPLYPGFRDRFADPGVRVDVHGKL